MIKIVLYIFYILVCVRTIHSQNGWVELNSGTNNYLNEIVFCGTDTGYICADGGQLLVTFNGGNNWTVRHLAVDPDIHFTAIHFFNSRTGFIASWGKIYRTTNAGLSIDTMNTFTDAYQSIYFPSANTGYAVSKYAGIYKSTDSGSNWIQIRPPGIGSQLSCIYFLDNLTGFIGGNDSALGFAKSINGGLSWISLNPISDISDIRFLQNYGFAAGRNSNEAVIYKTTDGSNWTSAFFSNNAGNLVGLSIPEDNVIYAVDINGTLIKSTNGGTNWNLHNTGCLYITNIYFVNSSTGYLINGEGRIYKTTTGGVPIGIQKISNEVPSVCNLHQNYPNPFNPVTTIKFDIPTPLNPPFAKGGMTQSVGFVRLIIYDILGKEISVLVNENLNPGSYYVKWDASAYSSGVYYYKLVSGDYTETKKMVLIK